MMMEDLCLVQTTRSLHPIYRLPMLHTQAQRLTDADRVMAETIPLVLRIILLDLVPVPLSWICTRRPKIHHRIMRSPNFQAQRKCLVLPGTLHLHPGLSITRHHKACSFGFPAGRTPILRNTHRQLRTSRHRNPTSIEASNDANPCIARHIPNFRALRVCSYTK